MIHSDIPGEMVHCTDSPQNVLLIIISTAALFSLASQDSFPQGKLLVVAARSSIQHTALRIWDGVVYPLILTGRII